MNRENTRLLNAVLTTILACIAVFAVAIYIFGGEGFWGSGTPVVIQPLPTVVKIPVVIDNTGAVEATGVMTNTGISHCTLDYTPVCGVDGETYSNTCTAQATGVVIAYEGECKKTELIFTGSENTGTVVVPPKKPDAKICTMEYAPVCGVDAQTYSNACMAGDVSVAHIGECDGTERKVYDATLYHLYSNTGIGYSFAMPKYSYYSGAGPRDGASHAMAISTTASGIVNFDTATVQVWFYKTLPATPPSDQSKKIENGTLYIKNNDTTGNAKIAKIVQTVIDSAE